jgi:hypothetical protein
MEMPGIYKMDSVSIKTAQNDTTYRNTNQLKIYTPDFMMYADVNDGDSVSHFGIGSYVMDKDTLTENVLFSANDSVSNDKPATYKLAIEKTKGGYKQFIYGMEGTDGSKFNLTEYYTNIGSPSTSVLDGAWKQVQAYSIAGTDTIRAVNNVQFKLFHSGYVMWGHSIKDSLNRTHTGVGYGKFTMTGDTKLKESMMASTYSVVTGHDFEIDVERMGADGFKQTITNKDGSRNVELYERLKK